MAAPRRGRVSRLMLTMTDDALDPTRVAYFETDEFRVIGAKDLPVEVGGEVEYVDGYRVIHKESGLVNAEVRLLGTAMQVAYEQTQLIEAVRRAEGGIATPNTDLGRLN